MPCEKDGQALAKPTEEELDLSAEVGQVSKLVISIYESKRSHNSPDCRLSLRESSVSC
jgi:hypothetical protein